MNLIDSMQEKLTQAFAPTVLKVLDDSAAHYGHDGATPGQVSHVAIFVVSEAFEGKGRVDRHRAVFAVVADEIKLVHAITQVKTLTPAEYAAQPKTA